MSEGYQRYELCFPRSCAEGGNIQNYYIRDCLGSKSSFVDYHVVALDLPIVAVDSFKSDLLGVSPTEHLVEVPWQMGHQNTH